MVWPNPTKILLDYFFLLLLFYNFCPFFRKKEEHTNHYEIVMKTTSQNGLLLWLGKNKSPKSDFICLALVNGFPQFSFKLGKQNETLYVTSKVSESFLGMASIETANGKYWFFCVSVFQVYVSDNRWHSIKVHRRKRRGYIQVDNEKPVKKVASSTSTVLTTNGKLYIGMN